MCLQTLSHLLHVLTVNLLSRVKRTGHVLRAFETVLGDTANLCMDVPSCRSWTTCATWLGCMVVYLARKKATYDKFGEEGLKGGIPLEFSSNGAWSSKYVYHGNPDQTFKQFFGGDNPFADFYTNDLPLQFSGLQPGVMKTQDSPIERDLHLSLDDLFHGCTKKIKISRRVMNDDGCTSSIKDKILTIDVKPGWIEGTRITFPKEGDQGPNSIPADIVFIVRQKTHPLFVRRNNDLIYKIKITLQMALTGFSVDVQTLDGRLLSVPINDIVHPAYKKVLSGEGMPLSKDPSQRGNLMLTFDIEFPKKLSTERKHLIKQALSLKD